MCFDISVKPEVDLKILSVGCFAFALLICVSAAVINQKQVITVINMASGFEIFQEQQQAAAQLLDFCLSQGQAGGILAVGYTVETAEVLMNTSSCSQQLTFRPTVLAEFVYSSNLSYSQSVLEASLHEANISQSGRNMSAQGQQGNITAAFELIRTIVGTESVVTDVSTGTLAPATTPSVLTTGTGAGNDSLSNETSTTMTTVSTEDNATNATSGTDMAPTLSTSMDNGTDNSSITTAAGTVPYVSVEYTSQTQVTSTSVVFLGLTESTVVSKVDSSISTSLQEANIEISAVSIVSSGHSVSSSESVTTSQAVLNLVSSPVEAHFLSTGSVAGAAATLQAKLVPGM